MGTELTYLSLSKNLRGPSNTTRLLAYRHYLVDMEPQTFANARFCFPSGAPPGFDPPEDMRALQADDVPMDYLSLAQGF